MTLSRDPDEILAAWLDEGPFRLPDATKRAIAVSTRTTHQTRRPMWGPWRNQTMNGTLRFALGAVAVVAVALGGLYLFGGAPGGGPGGPAASPSPSVPSPSAVTPSPSPEPVPAMVTPFDSPMYGYSLQHPAAWIANPADRLFDPVAAPKANDSGVYLDAIATPSGAGLLRAGSAAIPSGQDGEEWTARHITGCDATCRQGLDAIVIDGRTGYLQSSDEDEVEATVVAGDRVYLFTLFAGGPGGLQNLRLMFDDVMATVDLRPEDAIVAPSSSPSS